MDANVFSALIGVAGAGLITLFGFAIRSIFASFSKLRASVSRLQEALEAEKELNQELRISAELQRQVADAVKRAIGGPDVH